MKLLLPCCIALVVFGCGPTTPPVTMATFFPADNEVGAWVADTTVATPGLRVGKTTAAIELLVDGDAAPFTAKGVLSLGWEKYASGAYKLDARVWQMKDLANATDTYDGLPTSGTVYSANTWADLAVGQAGRIADTGTRWWLNARKSAFIVELKVEAKDATTRTEIETFAKAIAAKIP